MGNTMEAMGYSRQVKASARNSISYRLDALNPDCNLELLVNGLKRQPQGLLCLYGPPGTGKTAFGRFVAQAVDKPLLVKRASDLLGSYVGMTEKNISGMFNQARQDDMVLLLDEADSFLRDRNGARNSWEVTQVNELLTQMEDYQGLFISSTNLVESLDAASIRRFDYKIYFDYLKPDQAWMLFKQVLDDQRVPLNDSKHWKSKLLQFRNLTPGDFATVMRQNSLSENLITPDDLFNGLVSETSFKDNAVNHGIGFMANI